MSVANGLVPTIVVCTSILQISLALVGMQGRSYNCVSAGIRDGNAW